MNCFASSMIKIENNPKLGYYTVGTEKFFSKREAHAQTGAAQPATDKPASGLVVAVPASVSGPRVVPASIASASHGSAGAAAGG
mgnify:CR=1 FL=1